MTSPRYNQTFFDVDLSGSLESARVIVPILREHFEVNSVVDVGCGRGAWLQAFREAGVARIRGIDGAYIDKKTLMIDPKDFQPEDLEAGFRISEKFDLAMSVEVVEHLTPRAGARVVAEMTRAAPVVLFSAAIPGQGGTHHINEQWPAYWARLFGEQGYVALDLVRPRVWNDKRVEWWYQQNCWTYVRRSVAEASEKLRNRIVEPDRVDQDWIHASLYRRELGVPELARNLGTAVARAVRRRTSILGRRRNA